MCLDMAVISSSVTHWPLLMVASFLLACWAWAFREWLHVMSSPEWTAAWFPWLSVPMLRRGVQWARPGHAHEVTPDLEQHRLSGDSIKDR